jgi:hypothetical protein
MAEPGNGWELHRTEQLRRLRELSPQQRLDWLWQAKQFAAKAAEACAARRHPPDQTTGTGKDSRK